jgi:hypothetical protein
VKPKNLPSIPPVAASVDRVELPGCFPLNVFQSELERYPDVDVEDWRIDRDVPPELKRGVLQVIPIVVA